MSEEIKYEIIEEIAVLSESENGLKKKLCLISWGGKAPTYDIRTWNSKGAPYKGLTMTVSELAALRDALANIVRSPL